MKYMVSAIAAAALLAGGAHALPGNDKGKGNGNGKADHGAPAKGNGGGNAKSHGNGNGNGGPSMKAANPGKGPDKGPAMKSAMQSAKPDRGPPAKADKGNKDHGKPAMAQAARSGNGNGAYKDKGSQMAVRKNAAPTKVSARQVEGVRVLDDGRRIYDRDGARQWWGAYDRRGVIDGCPPGLAKKQNGCTPPGLAKTRQPSYRYRAYQPDWWGLRSILGGSNYYYDDGYLLRMNGGSVGGYIPLLGGALSIGQPWPDYYAPRPVPNYYVSYYDLGPQGGYRYADDVLYRVDPTSQAITSIAALLTGDDIRVGQPMPRGYDVYNVPYQYRSQYADGPNAYYRYSDGYIYQVDPTTRLVSAAIELLAS